MRRSKQFSVSMLVLSLVASVLGILIVTAPSTSAATVNPHNPVGKADLLASSGSTVGFRGWAVDPDMSGTVRIVITVDGVPARSVLANKPRPDVLAAHPSYGGMRGFTGAFTLPAGKHSVCLVVGDLGLGSDVRLGCKTFTIPRPVGEVTAAVPSNRRPVGGFDWYYAGSGRISVRGWAIDPDTRAPVLVDLMIGGNSLGSAVANIARTDVATQHPGWGARHGFAYTVAAPVAPGNYALCPVAVNNAAGGNTILPCRVMTIRPKTEPASLGSQTAIAAANAIQAEAISSGAAPGSAFNPRATAAARIAIATRALLRQATGRGPRPAPVVGVPAFTKATTAKPVDEQAVMGPKPYLGTYPAAKKGGRTGPSASLQVFLNDAMPASPSAGAGIIGAAPVLLPNGVTVRPNLPGYPAGYQKLRAEVAIDAALAHLGDPYVWAAAGPGTFDCSGLTQWAWAKAGVRLGHYTGSQALQGVRVAPSQLLPGDLVLFGADLHHVGLYIGAGYMLDAPDTGAYVRADKISWFGDFALAVRP